MSLGLSSLEEEIVVYHGRGTPSLVCVEHPVVPLVLIDDTSYILVMSNLDAFPLFHLFTSLLGPLVVGELDGVEYFLVEAAVLTFEGVHDEPFEGKKVHPAALVDDLWPSYFDEL